VQIMPTNGQCRHSQCAIVEYSEYFIREIDDEVHKHLPDYEKHLDVLRALGKWQFEREELKLHSKRSIRHRH
jgi:hypothetical protein